jgi:alkaline phosphatase
MAEMDDLAKTLEYLEDYVRANPDTLVVLTADHSTGGFTLGRDGDYLWQPDVLRTMTMSPSTIAKNLAKNSITISYVNEMLNFAITENELETLKATKATTQQSLAEFKQSTQKKGNKAPSIEKALHMKINHIIDQRTVTGWTTFGHTAVDVPVFAIGKQKELFQGLSDNTEIAEKIFHLLGKG